MSITTDLPVSTGVLLEGAKLQEIKENGKREPKTTAETSGQILVGSSVALKRSFHGCSVQPNFCLQKSKI